MKPLSTLSILLTLLLALGCSKDDEAAAQDGGETGDEPPALEQDQNLVAVVPRRNGQRIAVIDRKARSFIRGLHYDRATGEHRPPAADLLNPDAMAQFIRCVYDVFAKRFGEHFGNTIAAIFTDEPGLLAKCVESTEVRPGTTGILEHINRILGYDFTPHLPALWYDDVIQCGTRG